MMIAVSLIIIFIIVCNCTIVYYSSRASPSSSSLFFLQAAAAKPRQAPKQQQRPQAAARQTPKITPQPRQQQKTTKPNRIQQVVDKLNSVNTSGKLQANSNWQSLVDQGAIKFTNGKWVVSNAAAASSTPSQQRLQNALNAYMKHNKSGVVHPDSNYKDLVQKGYLYFKDGKWNVRQNPTSADRQPVSKGNNNGRTPIKEVVVKGKGVQNAFNKDAAQSGWNNNSYESNGKRLPDKIKTLEKQSGYTLMDPSNIIGQTKGCKDGRSSCAPAISSESDIKKLKQINDKIVKNGGVPVAYMSLTIEPNREDISKLKKGKDFTSGTMQGWDEHAPKAGANGDVTQNYKKLMKERIDKMAQSGYKYIEFDNIDIVHDSKVGKQSGLDTKKWKDTVMDLVKYAKESGVGVLQKNTPEWVQKNPSAQKEFAGMVIEIEKSASGLNKNNAYWEQVANMVKSGKPVILNRNTSQSCSSLINRVKSLTNTSDADAKYFVC